MNREIKFRAWDNKEKCFFYDFSIHSSGYLRSNTVEEDNLKLPDMMNDKERFEIMQFTGLQSSDGIDIYEGDILKLLVRELRKDEEHTGEIIFKDGTFGITNCFFDFGGKMFLRPLLDLIAYPGIIHKVAGNIFENTDILELKNERR